MKPKYSELVKALQTLKKWTDHSLLNACSAKEIRDSYAELQRASVRAGQLVKRAKHPNAELSDRHENNP